MDKARIGVNNGGPRALIIVTGVKGPTRKASRQFSRSHAGERGSTIWLEGWRAAKRARVIQMTKIANHGAFSKIKCRTMVADASRTTSVPGGPNANGKFRKLIPTINTEARSNGAELVQPQGNSQ